MAPTENNLKLPVWNILYRHCSKSLVRYTSLDKKVEADERRQSIILKEDSVRSSYVVVTNNVVKTVLSEVEKISKDKLLQSMQS